MIKTAVYLPKKIVHNDDFINKYSDWNSKKTLEQTGVEMRHYAAEDESSATLGYNALMKLVEKYNIDINTIDFLICVTETPDNVLPATAYKIHKLANLPKTCGAYDINHGCAGFTYGLLTAYNFIKAGSASNVVLITVDILSKFMEHSEKAIQTLIGDGAAACLITKHVCDNIMKFVYGTDSQGYDRVIVKHRDDDPDKPLFLHMDGMDVFSFAMHNIQNIVNEILNINNLSLDEIDMVIVHQANKIILEFIKRRLKLPDDRFYINMRYTGNTSSATIPIALNDLQENELLKHNQNILVLGFGVGYSWCGTVIKWNMDKE
ncbi:MAG: ketoacyl-ACP synthase III [Mucispirillum sp.]|nr:ketoacyl-ACP synthase III [Mucispirillum sp.]